MHTGSMRITYRLGKRTYATSSFLFFALVVAPFLFFWYSILAFWYFFVLLFMATKAVVLLFAHITKTGGDSAATRKLAEWEEKIRESGERLRERRASGTPGGHLGRSGSAEVPADLVAGQHPEVPAPQARWSDRR